MVDVRRHRPQQMCSCRSTYASPLPSPASLRNCRNVRDDRQYIFPGEGISMCPRGFRAALTTRFSATRSINRPAGIKAELYFDVCSLFASLLFQRNFLSVTELGIPSVLEKYGREIAATSLKICDHVYLKQQEILYVYL